MTRLSRDDVQSMIDRALRKAIPYEMAPLSRALIDVILETMRLRLAKSFGVTLQQDENGAWGKPVGSRTVVLRFSNPSDADDLICISMTIDNVSSSKADRRLNDDNRATPK